MTPAKVTRPFRIASLTLCGVLLCGVANAADPVPAGSPPAPPVLTHPDEPAAALITLAEHLERDPNQVVLVVATLPITQYEVATAIRTMPANMGNLPSPEIVRRAMDIVARQKAMVLRARQEHLEADPNVVRNGQIALERVLGDAWLQRRANAAVTDQALHARYERDFAGKPGPDEVRARVILVTNEALALDIIQQARNGADFADLARKYSKDPSAEAGGDYGYLARDVVTPEIGAAMFSLAPGEVSSYPIATLIGYFVIRVEGRRRGPTLTFDQARFRLEQQVRSEAVAEAIDSLMSNIKFIQPDPSQGSASAKP